MLLLLKYKRSIKSAKRLLLEFEVSSDSLLLPYLILFQHSFFHYIDQSIQSHCHNTEQNNRHEKPIHLKYLTGIDDQISKSAFGSEKFSDDHTDQAETDIDLENADHGRQGGREDHRAQSFSFAASKSMDELDLLAVSLPKCSIHADNAAKDSDRHAGNNDGARAASKPYDQKRCQCRFWKTVENYQPGFQYLGDSWKDPQKSGSQKTDADDKQKTDQCLI